MFFQQLTVKMKRYKQHTVALAFLFGFAIGWFLGRPISFLVREHFNAVCPIYEYERHFIVGRLQSVIKDLHVHASRQLWSRNCQQKLKRVIRLFTLQESPLTGSVVIDRSPQMCHEKHIHIHSENRGFWVKEDNCKNESPLEKLVTIVLVPDSRNPHCNQSLRWLLKTISKYNSDIPVIIGLPNGTCKVDKERHVLVVDVRAHDTVGRIFNKLVSLVSTPYVLIARNITSISWYTRLERQIAVLSSDSLVKVVGGSFKNISGHWQIGCYQSNKNHYQLNYEEGYLASNNECLYCDHLTGPFLAKTSQFYIFAFDDTLASDVVFEDFFLTLKHLSYLVMNCPDALYFVNETRIAQKPSWVSLAEKWQLNRILAPDGVLHKFSCQEVKMTCKNLDLKTRSHLVPTCCMDLLLEGLKTVHQFLIEKDILYYISGKTLLGAVKFGDLLPWEYHGDIYYLQEPDAVLGKFQSFKNEVALETGIFEQDGKIRIYLLDDVYIEMKGINNSDKYKHPNQVALKRKYATLVRIRGQWFYAPPNPAHFARDIYGEELFQHSNYVPAISWYDPYHGRAQSFVCNDSRKTCYDYLPMDGSFSLVFP